MFQHEERLQPDDTFSQHYATFSEYQARYVFASRWMGPGGQVLDLGCGNGYGTAFLKESAGRRVIGCDRSRTALTFAQGRYRSLAPTFIQGDATELPIRSNSLDTVVSYEMIEHVQDDKRLVAEVYRVLKPGGYVIVSTPNRVITGTVDQPANPFHVREYNVTEFQHLLEHAFPQVAMFGHALSPAARRQHEMLARLWRNAALVPVLYNQVHSLEKRLERDERVLGLHWLRLLKRSWTALWRPRHGVQEQPCPDLNSLFEHGDVPPAAVSDWDISSYQVQTAPVLIAVCRK